LDEVSDAMIGIALGASGSPEAEGLAADPTLPQAVRTAAALDGALESCDVVGGTAPVRVAAALKATRERLEREIAAS
ncbi:MAG TPA: hypothetical protein VIV06_12480, partial [Candidatus Limnocylindrales bacterium]